jgi:hypothetical protein
MSAGMVVLYTCRLQVYDDQNACQRCTSPTTDVSVPKSERAVDSIADLVEC